MEAIGRLIEWGIDSEDREWSWKAVKSLIPSLPFHLAMASGKCGIVETAEGAGEILSSAADGEGRNRALLAVKALSEYHHDLVGVRGEYR